jgi:hypothetical protein
MRSRFRRKISCASLSRSIAPKQFPLKIFTDFVFLPWAFRAFLRYGHGPRAQRLTGAGLGIERTFIVTVTVPLDIARSLLRFIRYRPLRTEPLGCARAVGISIRSSKLGLSRGMSQRPCQRLSDICDRARPISLTHVLTKMSTPSDKQIEVFVRATGGGKGTYEKDNSYEPILNQSAKQCQVFNQNERCKAAGLSGKKGLGFGRVKFRNDDEPKPYVRVPWDNGEGVSTPSDLLLHFVEHVWGLERPHLVVSVTGAATDSLKNSDDLQLFLLDLMSFARRTSAWITTGGTNGGIMKLIGEVSGFYLHTIVL